MFNLTLAQLGMPDPTMIILGFMKSLLFFYIIPFLPLVFLLMYGMVMWVKKTEESEEDAKDELLGFKVGVYTLEIAVIHMVILSVFMLVDFIFSKMTSAAMGTPFLKASLALFLGSSIVLAILEFMLIKADVAKNFIPRKVAYSIVLFITGFFAVFFTSKFLGSIIEFPKGAEFHAPLAGTLVYMPLFVLGSVYFVKNFKENTGVHTFLPASLVNKANQMVNSAAGSAFGGAVMGGMQQPQAGQPMGQQYSQPMGGAAQQPMGQQYSQPMGGAPQQPMQQQYSQQQPAAAQPQAAAGGQVCPTCGGAARYIQQYNRYYCDSCKKYL